MDPTRRNSRAFSTKCDFRPSAPRTAGLAWLALLAVAGCGDNLTPAAGPDAGDLVLDCLPNLDGAIDADEMPVALGVAGDYWISPDGTSVDLAGAVDSDGRRVWQLGGESASDRRIAVAASPLTGRWYAGSFPAGELVLPLDPDDTVEAIYARDDAALWLLGVASATADPPAGRTLLVYQPAVAVLRFPLAPGRQWTETATITGGELDGLPYNGTDTYEIDSDVAGRVVLPYVRFEQAHRVRTRVTVTPAVGGMSTTRWQVSFVSECFGEIARAVSRTGETDPDFATAAELWRFAL